ncbi:hypothetical protein [Nannocystis punicea]|uniref:Uncharacterized protein n=1 Tax=Nannocystis punicea TaxID=2995304 RepID=A0ABY7HBC3_9BACT|nr:hypothetical protein [Nannocystis poenicansa]WAS96567.1 hypothetical protein O0S08_10450 [Nannocystis poenicansa]
MRTATSLVIGLVLAACDPGAGPEPTTDPTGPTDPTDSRPGSTTSLAPGLDPVHTLTFPAVLAASHELLTYADLDGEQASARTELAYGLHPDYPDLVTLLPGVGIVLAPECQAQQGELVWHSLAEVEGSAARLELRAGALAIELREAGTVSALLHGELRGQDCALPGVTTVVPLAHRIVLQVDRVAGFMVEQFHQQLGDCRDRVVLPADAPLWAPTARALADDDTVFEPINAPTPVGITLRSPGALTAGPDPWSLTAEPGLVAIDVATTLPVRGLASFTVVGPEALTSVDAALHLRRAAGKGTLSEPIEPGTSYALFFPDQRNTVELHVDAATTELGKLCENPPTAWFASTSPTPAVCTAPAASDDEPTSFIPVARVVTTGECRLAVELPGTTHRWATWFRTTP